MNRHYNRTLHLVALAGMVALIVVLAGKLMDPRDSEGESDLPATIETPSIAPTPPLAADERSTVEVFERVSSSVVSVANTALVRGGFMGMRVYEVPQGMGSGIVWDRKGHILSNFHVVRGASSIRVIMSNGDEYEAEVVGVDPDHDIAVIKVDAPASKLNPVTVGTSQGLKVGQKVLAIGNPFGFDCSLSVGVVSSLSRSMRSVTGITIHDVIQTDAAINSGNSGGPLLDGTGRLIGVNTAIVSPTGGSVGIGFAIPIDMVSEVVPQLISHGKVRKAGLGVQLLPDYVTRRYGIRGAVIGEVLPGGGAARSKLRGTANRTLGDVIISIDGKPIESTVDLREVLLGHKAGDTVEVEYVRERREAKVHVTLQTLE